MIYVMDTLSQPIKVFKQPEQEQTLLLFIKKNKISLIIAASVILLLLTGVGILVFGQKKSMDTTKGSISPSPTEQTLAAPTVPVSQAQNQPISSVSATPTITTSTWNTYKNTVYKYQLQYPGDWTLKNTASPDSKILEYLVLNPIILASNSASITVSYTTRTYTEALALSTQIGEIMKVASISSTKTTEKNSDGNISIRVVVPINNNANTFIFVAQDAYKDILTQILATFKLL